MDLFGAITAVPLAGFWWSLCLVLYVWALCVRIFYGMIGRSV